VYESMKNTFVIVAIAMVTFFSCSPSEEKVRPMEMWAFRSVMDEQPRILTAALHDDLWVSYDVQRGLLYKAWKGDVNFDGAVYTTVHGPQPTSLGYAFFEKSDDQWVVMKDAEPLSFKLKYKGHSVLDNQLKLTYKLQLEDGNTITIIERPEHTFRGNQTGLVRQYEIDGQEGYQVGLKTSYSSLMSEADFSTTGKFELDRKQQVEYNEGSTLTLEGILWISNGTLVKNFFHPGFDKLIPVEEEMEEENEELAGAALIERSDCESCHNEEVKTVGPAYVQVARKYDDSEASVEMLASKVIKGGSGVWGEALMTAHPDLMEEDAKEMIRYILSLDDNDAGGEYNKFSLGLKSIPIKLGENNKSSGGPGWAVHAYKAFESDGSLEDILSRNPVKNGIVEKLHAFSEQDFDVFRSGFLLQVQGNIDIAQDGSYDFRVISDDGSWLSIDGNEIIDNGGFHGPQIRDGEVWLTKGKHKIDLTFFQAGGGAFLSIQMFDKKTGSFVLLDESTISHTSEMMMETSPYVESDQLAKAIPGDREWLAGLHPSYDLFQARPDDFQPRVGGLEFLPDGRMLVCTWDSLGPVYVVDNWQSGDPAQMSVKLIASGLAEPLGIKVVDGDIYVLQKQELTKLIDEDGDEIIDRYETVSDDWRVSANFHEFAFGLEYQDGYFYGALATAILPGGASAQPQIPDRGKVLKISKETGVVELIAHGLRTPNGIGKGKDGALFIADNQGDWLPASKIVHVKEGAFYGQRSVDPEGTADLPVTLPVVWLPQDEIGNSPSTPLALDHGPYQGQMIHGEVTHGGVKRVFVEEVNGNYQGAVFRFTQGIEAGVNRISWAPDGSLMIGGIGVSGNWGQTGKLKYGLQRMVYNEKSTFEMLSVSAKSDGFEITFTEPIKQGQYINQDDFVVQQWYYLPTAEYGGPKLELETLKPSRFSISEDRKTVFFSIPGLKENHMVYFRIVRPFESEMNHELWSTEAWYTLNYIPESGAVNHADYQVMNNSLTSEEESQGWKMLFDGKSRDGLRNFNQTSLNSKWIIDGEAIHMTAGGAGDMVVTDQVYENYEFYMEWKISTGGNSGIIFNTKEGEDYPYPWLTGPEMQILDNERHPDGQIFKHRAGDLYDLIPTKFVTANGPNEWNRVRIVMKDGHLQQWLNGYKVVETTLWNDQWNEMVKGSKFKEMPDFGTARSGHIVLQDHNDKVWFRNIKIKKL
jgi:cytochrome c